MHFRKSFDRKITKYSLYFNVPGQLFRESYNFLKKIDPKWGILKNIDLVYFQPLNKMFVSGSDN